MEYERDETGRWLAGVSAPTRAARGMALAQQELTTRMARRMGMNATDVDALRLLDLHGPLGPSELARLLGLRPASVTTLVDRLETAGHLERVRESADRRRVTLRASPDAARRLFDTWAPVVAALDAVGHDLAPHEQEVVCVYLDRVAAVMRGAGREPGSAGDVRADAPGGVVHQ